MGKFWTHVHFLNGHFSIALTPVAYAAGTYNANKAIVDANQANVKQLQTLQSFERIYAPFDGIITARNTDIGQLIASGRIPIQAIAASIEAEMDEAEDEAEMADTSEGA